MTTELKTYEGVERVRARPMSHGEYIAFRGWQLPADGNPADEGYLVECVGDFISWCPKNRFDRAYREVGQGMSFGDALKSLKAGQRVARAGWNGKGMFVYLVPAASYPVQTGAAKAHFGDGAMVPYNAYMAIKNVDETVSTWVPSVNDCIAEDWEVLA